MVFGFIRNLLGKGVIPIVKINGPINAKSSQNVDKALSKISSKPIKALAVVVNSPGGSPAQSQIICDKIITFSRKRKVPLYTFAEDIAASGGYFILTIGDKVYVHENSLVGSIGVISNWIGFKGILEKNKIESRVFSSNEVHSSKILNPLSNLEPESLALVESLVKNTHRQFKDHVLQYRKDKIKVPSDKVDEKILNADVFTGSKSIELGLADEIGSWSTILKREFPGARLVNCTHASVLERLQSARANVEALELGLEQRANDEDGDLRRLAKTLLTKTL